MFTDLIRSFTISTLQLTMDSSHMSPQLSSACNHYKYDSKQHLKDIFSRHDKLVLRDIDPDTNFLNNLNHTMTSEYYNEISFNNTFSDNQYLSLLHLNIRSVPLHYTEFVSYLDTLNVHFKIIALSETAINSHHAIYRMPNYSIEMNHREKKKGGGTSIYIHNSLQYTVRRELQLGGDCNSVFIEILKTSINTKCNLICGCVYRPPFMSLKLFNEHLACVLGVLQGERQYVYITGDFNVNTLPIYNGGLARQEFINIFSSGFFCPLINRPTRVTQNSSTLIDNISCNIPNIATSCKAGILRTSISDHYAIFCISRNETLSNDRRCIEKRSFSEKNIFAFNNRVTNESWDFVYETECMQLAFTRFQGVINQHFETNFKMQSFTTNYKNRHPWMTKALRTQIKIKNAMHTTCFASLTKDITKFADYNKVKNLLKSSLRNSILQ